MPRLLLPETRQSCLSRAHRNSTPHNTHVQTFHDIAQTKSRLLTRVQSFRDFAKPGTVCTCCGTLLQEECCSTSFPNTSPTYSFGKGLNRGRRHHAARQSAICKVAEVDAPTAVQPTEVILVPTIEQDASMVAHVTTDIVPVVRNPRPVALLDREEWDSPSEAGVLPEQILEADEKTILVEPDQSNLTSHVRDSWHALMRWSKVLRNKKDPTSTILQEARKIVVFGGGSFGTAMGVALARQQPDLEVVLLLRDPLLCRDINKNHCNTKYLKGFTLPSNVRATTLATEAIVGATYAVHAVPVQASRKFLVGIKDLLPPTVPIICVSKGLEVPNGHLMSEVIPSALERRQPAVFLSGPSFAKEVMEHRPTGVVAACKDPKLGRLVQSLFASPVMRVNTTSDVLGVEICGALKNVLAIAAGIVEGMDLGHNAMAALISQGCAEIRWLAEKMGAKPSTISGLSGLGDIMLTCYGSLSRNRSVGVRLGRGEGLADILGSTSQVAEGVATAGVVVLLAKRHRVSLPVLTAVAQVVEGNITPHQAVWDIMNLPQIEEV